MSGDSADTVICSVLLPTSSAKSTVSVCATCKATLSRIADLNPGAVTVMRYVPGGSDGMRYTPASVLTEVNSTPVSGFTILTDAPATAAPDGSVTVPLKVPRSPCANNAKAAARHKITALLIFKNPSKTGTVFTRLGQSISQYGRFWTVSRCELTWENEKVVIGNENGTVRTEFFDSRPNGRRVDGASSSWEVP